MRKRNPYIPAHIDTADPEAIRGTARVRLVDPAWLIGFNTIRAVYELWGPSLERCWCHLLDVRADDGTPFRGVVPWERIVAALQRGRDAGERLATETHEHNERLRAANNARESARLKDIVRYGHRGILAEQRGASRWASADVAEGYQNRWT